MALKLASKLLVLVTIFLAFSVIQVSARMTCKGNNLKSKKEPGLLCLEGYVPYDAKACGNICSCDGNELKCTPPDNCVAEEFNSIEDFCAIGPNYDWTCACPEKKVGSDALLKLPYLSHNVSEIPHHGRPSVTMPGFSTETDTLTLQRGTPLTLSVGTGASTSTMKKGVFPSRSHVSHSTSGSHSHGIPHVTTTHATTMHTSIVPRSALEQASGTCVIELSRNGCLSDSTELIIDNKNECVSVTDDSHTSFKATSCDFEGCYFFDDQVCNGGSFENARAYKKGDTGCHDLGDNFYIGSFICY